MEFSLILNRGYLSMKKGKILILIWKNIFMSSLMKKTWLFGLRRKLKLKMGMQFLWCLVRPKHCQPPLENENSTPFQP